MSTDMLQLAAHTGIPEAAAVHFVGIGGSGMSPLAEILHTMGYAVTGSDAAESDNTARMRSLGIPVIIGHSAGNIGAAQLVVYTTAVSRDNPELAAAVGRGIPLLERAALLGLITRGHPRTIAVSGTHGKTTTTSMLAQILLEAGRDPSVFIGGRLPLIGANGRAGESGLMVCEACEFQDHYLQLAYATAVILNIDADHLDWFGSLEGVIASFRQYAARATGVVIANADDPNTVAALEGIAVPVEWYGGGANCKWQIVNGRLTGAYGRFTLLCDGEFFADISLGAPGAHNIYNAAAAAAAAVRGGATAEEIAAGLAHFRGAGRRFEFIGESVPDSSGGVITVADDYAHHPTEITATLAAARQMGYARVLAVFQPFTFSRTARHLEEFAAALSAADIAVVCDILGSREENIWNVSSEQIAARISNGVYCPTFDDVTRYITAQARPGDLVLTMGGGDIYKCARQIYKMLNAEC